MTKIITFAPGVEVEVPTQQLKAGTALYLAGPLGFAEATRYFHHQLIQLVTAMGGRAIDPWVLTPDSVIQQATSLPYGPERKAAWQKLNPQIAGSNEAGIREATGLVAVLDGVDVDSGTAAEIGMAYAWDKPIIGYRGDFRLSADNEGSMVNLQVENCIRRSGNGQGNVITTIKDLPQELLRVWGA